MVDNHFSVTVNGQNYDWSKEQVRQKLEHLGSLNIERNLVRVSSDLSFSRSFALIDKIWRVLVSCIPKLAEFSRRRLERANATLEDIGKQIEAHPTLRGSFNQAQQALNKVALRNLSVDGRFKKIVTEVDEESLDDFQTIMDIFRLKALIIKGESGTKPFDMLRVVQLIPRDQRSSKVIKTIIALFEDRYVLGMLMYRLLELVKSFDATVRKKYLYKLRDHLNTGKLVKEYPNLSCVKEYPHLCCNVVLLYNLLPGEKRNDKAFNDILNFFNEIFEDEDSDCDLFVDDDPFVKAIALIPEEKRDVEVLKNTIRVTAEFFGDDAFLCDYTDLDPVFKAFELIPEEKRDVEVLKNLVDIFKEIDDEEDSTDIYEAVEGIPTEKRTDVIDRAKDWSKITKNGKHQADILTYIDIIPEEFITKFKTDFEMFQSGEDLVFVLKSIHGFGSTDMKINDRQWREYIHGCVDWRRLMFDKTSSKEE